MVGGSGGAGQGSEAQPASWLSGGAQPGQGLRSAPDAHADLHRLMGAAAQRVARQRLVDSQLSSSIQALRTQGDGVAELKHTLSLRTALAAPAGAVQAR
ncbi:hypothetical protein HaLaN_21544 [Haematococcus lacustris]|uniref:Uncharacterized protein n=1 Tax=Haematococcus lacustris TaxID=44745 RepID=A0A699ZYL2_HAELA|nr:hypothetical protein HaLaN_21544 [Haematococcus lacustris]